MGRESMAHIDDVKEGSYVVHPRKPEWGIGKVYCFKAGYVLVGWANLAAAERLRRLKWQPGLLVLADASSNSVLDGTSPECTADCKPIVRHASRDGRTRRRQESPPQAVWTLEQAYERFTVHYSEGFRDQRYQELERPWKVSQRELWEAEVNGVGFRSLAEQDPAQAARLILRVVQTGKKPLLHPKGEIVQVRDALGHTANLPPFLAALADLLEADTVTSDHFDRYVEVLTSLPLDRPGNLAKWPIVTVLPFLVQPTRHIFVKPVPTKKLSALLGHEILYSPRPKWDTYERVLAFSQWLLESLSPYGAADMIDVQSFTYVSTYEGS